MDLDVALQAHVAWKAKLKEAAQNGTPLDAQTLRKDDCCELGKWLHGEGSQRHGHRPEFVALLEKHKGFHATTGALATFINTRQGIGRPLALEDLHQYEAASKAVGLAIAALQKSMNTQVLP